MDTDATLTRTRRNDVLQLLQQYAGFDGSEFTLEESVEEEPERYSYGSYRSTRLLHKPTGYYFRFGKGFCMYCPGARSKLEAVKHESSWEAIRGMLVQWANRVKAESEAPDLWATINNGQGFIQQAPTSIDNSPFTKDEQSLIADKLDDLEDHLKRQDQFAEDQLDHLHSEFTYLKEAATRIGRKDWRLIAFSVLAGQVLALTLPPETAQAFMQLAQSLFQWIWVAGQHLLTQAPI